MIDVSKPYHVAFREIAETYPLKPAIIYNGRSVTYQELDDFSDYTAFYLHERGIRPNDNVALWMSNCAEWVILQLALSKLGAVSVPVNTRMRTHDAGYIVNQSDSVALIIANHPAADFEEMAADISKVVHEEGKPLQIFCIDNGQEHRPGIHYFHCFGYASEEEKKTVSKLSKRVNGDDLFALYYTSGTTDRPKGAMLVQGVVTRHTFEIAEAREISAEDVLFLPLPLFGVMALQGLLGLILHGGTVVLQDGFEAKKALELMDKHRCTILYSVEAMCRELFKELENRPRDLSYMKMVSVSPASNETIRKIFDEWKVPVIRGYGLTEATSVVSSDRYNEPVEVIVNTNGYPLKHIELKIVNLENFLPCAPNEAGEIWVKGYTVMKGYYKKEMETKETITSDGWLRTGDIGFMDDEGRLVFVDRIKDMYKSGGFNVSATEVENYLKKHPDVNDVAVVGVPDPALNEIGVAFIVSEPNRTIREEEIIQFCKGKIATFKIPKKVIFVDELPRTPTGKVRKIELKENYGKITEQV